MTKEEFQKIELKPDRKDFYYVSLFQFGKEKKEYPSYIKDWIEFDGKDWDYGDYKKRCCVCEIHKRDNGNELDSGEVQKKLLREVVR